MQADIKFNCNQTVNPAGFDGIGIITHHNLTNKVKLLSGFTFLDILLKYIYDVLIISTINCSL